jgi:AraC-like DNA-binding protein
MDKNTTEYFGYLAPSDHAAISGIAVGNGPLAAAKTLDILARLTAVTRPMQTPSRLKQIVRRARLLLEERPEFMPVIDDMIQGFDGSRSHVFRAFRRETGQTPSGYPLRLSIRRASDMLRTSDLPTKDCSRARLSQPEPYF